MNIDIRSTRGHWEVTVDGEFYCSADTFTEAVEELKDVYKCANPTDILKGE